MAISFDRPDVAAAANNKRAVTGGQRISKDVYPELESRGVAL